MKRFLICTLLLLSKYAISQEALLPGRWDACYFITRGDTASQTRMDFALGKNNFIQLGADHRYVLYEKEAYKYGDWKLTGNKLKLIPDSGGTIYQYEAGKMAANELELSISTSKIGYTRATTSPAAIKKPAPDKPIRVKANSKQLVKKWYFSKVIAPANTPEGNISIWTAMYKRSSFELRANGASTRIFSKPEEGIWELTDGGKRLLIIDNNGIGQAWDIITITANELTLQAPGTAIQRVYAVEAI